MKNAKRIVITGSSRGIGKGLAGELLRRGHHVVISGRTQASADAAARELLLLASGGARVLGVGCEVSKCSMTTTVPPSHSVSDTAACGAAWYSGAGDR